MQIWHSYPLPTLKPVHTTFSSHKIIMTIGVSPQFKGIIYMNYTGHILHIYSNSVWGIVVYFCQFGKRCVFFTVFSGNPYGSRVSKDSQILCFWSFVEYLDVITSLEQSPDHDPQR